MQELREFLRTQKEHKKIIYPKMSDVFSAFQYVPLDEVKVVILGQDPYHGPKQAHGMCFSVMPGIKPPPSLMNIYKELQADLGVQPVAHGCLIPWAKQGILLLNAVLTVEHGKAGSHHGKGWERFTDKVVHLLNEIDKPLIFVLWGAQAQLKGQHIDTTRHVVLKAAHPSPFSAHRGFLGCRHFSKINELLSSFGSKPIEWQLPMEYVFSENTIV